MPKRFTPPGASQPPQDPRRNPDVDRTRRIAMGVLIIGLAVAALVTIVRGISGAGTKYRPEIAYATGLDSRTFEIWLADGTGGDARRLGPGSRPLVSPNGAFVAATVPHGGGAELVIYDVAKGTRQAFFASGATTARALAWTRDSDYVAVALSSTGPDHPRGSGLGVIATATMTSETVDSGVVEGASFLPGADKLVFGLSPASTRVDLYAFTPGQGAPAQLTHDGVSLNPIAGPTGIAFDRRTGDAIASTLVPYLISVDKPRAARPLAAAGTPAQGLVPVAFSADGRSLLASAPGEDGLDQAWVVPLGSGQARELSVPGGIARAQAVSRSGDHVLVEIGAGRRAEVAVVPLSGGTPQVLVQHGSEPSWNL